MGKLIHCSTSFCQETVRNRLFLFLLIQIFYTLNRKLLKLSNSVDIIFGKSSNSGFNLLLEETEHNEQLPVLQIIAREQDSLGKMIAALYRIIGNDQL